MIKVDIISGFLGAGKTTLIKKLYKDVFKQEKVVLIENEFGEIGIDSAFLKDSKIEIKEINSGCICCSLVGDFATAMKDLIKQFSPERIIIEPSGVGKLSDIINSVNNLKEHLQLNIVTTVVDGAKTKLYLKNFGEFFINQVEAAKSIIVSKTDKITEKQLIEVVEIIKERNTKANLITTSLDKLDSAELLHVLEKDATLEDEINEELEKAKHHHEHHHDDEDECCCGHHHEHEHEHHHDDEDECCCGHHHEHEHHHDDEGECRCGHHHEHEHHHDDEDECCCGHHHDHAANEVFVSWGKETPKSISKIKLVNFLNYLKELEHGFVVRSKGVLKANDADTWYYFDYVSGDYQVREGTPEVIGKIVVIGKDINTQEIEHKFFEEV